jgi:3-hydroxybutyryl-CoA dehydrogenase
MTAKQTILIVGESPLVEEYASLCHNRGFAVSVRLNPEFARAAVPSGMKRVTRPSRSFKMALELTNIDLGMKRKNLAELDTSLGQSAVIISSSVTVTVAEQCSWVGRAGRLIGIGALPTLLQNDLIEFAESIAPEPAARKAAEDFSAALGKKSAFVADSVGMVLPRILSMLANEACFAMAEKVATGTDIDTAMKLGTNYPAGPVEWAGKIGIRQVHAVLQAVYNALREDRYRPSPLLSRAARTNTLPNS